MDQGKVVEFDTPMRLLSNKQGMFATMVDKSGPEAAKKLRDRIMSVEDQMIQEASTSMRHAPTTPSSANTTTTKMPFGLEKVFSHENP